MQPFVYSKHLISCCGAPKQTPRFRDESLVGTAKVDNLHSVPNHMHAALYARVSTEEQKEGRTHVRREEIVWITLGVVQGMRAAMGQNLYGSILD